MTEQEAPPELEIEFRGRQMYVRMPSPEQLLVWQRTLKQLQNMEGNDWNAAQVMAALERCRKIIDSLLANHTDIDWLDDEMLAGTLGFQEIAPLITLAVEAYQRASAETGNRDERRAAKKATPAKKATRKAATR